MKRQSVLIRTDIISKLDFSEKFKISRTKLDALIRAGMLPGELISGLFYISIANTKAIDEALSYKSRNPRHWSKGGTSVFKPKVNLNTADGRFDAAWEQFQKENP